jgi:hypothetical protein
VVVSRNESSGAGVQGVGEGRQVVVVSVLRLPPSAAPRVRSCRRGANHPLTLTLSLTHLVALSVCVVVQRDGAVSDCVG